MTIRRDRIRSAPRLSRLGSTQAQGVGASRWYLGIGDSGRTMKSAVVVGSFTGVRGIPEAHPVGLDEPCEVELSFRGVCWLRYTMRSFLLWCWVGSISLSPRHHVASNRGQTVSVPIENVIFELGLFIGGLGRERMFLLSDRTQELELPQDLAGMTRATFVPHSSGNVAAALGEPCTRIKASVARPGLRGMGVSCHVAHGPASKGRASTASHGLVTRDTYAAGVSFGTTRLIRVDCAPDLAAR
jgi:hypothetical protein